jgi:hypothetical protein
MLYRLTVLSIYAFDGRLSHLLPSRFAFSSRQAVTESLKKVITCLWVCCVGRPLRYGFVLIFSIIRKDLFTNDTQLISATVEIVKHKIHIFRMIFLQISAVRFIMISFNLKMRLLLLLVWIIVRLLVIIKSIWGTFKFDRGNGLLLRCFIKSSSVSFVACTGRESSAHSFFFI